MNRLRKSLALLSVMVASGVAPGSSADATGECFSREDNKRLSYEVFQVSAPPAYSVALGDYAPTNPAYPGSHFITAWMERLYGPSTAGGSRLHFRKSFLFWVNRCVYLPGITPDIGSCGNVNRNKGNGYFDIVKDASGRQVRPVFSNYAKANACTYLQLNRVLGDFSQALAHAATKAGLVLWDGSNRTELPRLARDVKMSNGEVMPYFVDVCILEARALPSDADGVVLDYEVWDERTADNTLETVRQLSSLAHQKGKELQVSMSPIPRAPNGIDASNIRDIVIATDGVIIAISTGSTLGNESIRFAPRGRTLSHFESYRNQVAVLTDGGRIPLTQELKSKIAWNIGLYDIKLEEARQLHDEIKKQGYRGIMISRAFMKQGGACTRQENQITACLALGDCSGRFGAER